MNNFKRRALIFVTFFGSCLAISLLTASLNTNYWTTAECKRTTDNKEKSNGTVNMGLFFYEASLNFGLGDRHYPEKMLGSKGILYLERQFLVYELYIATIACVVAGIFFGIISAMLAIVNTGSNPVEAICHVPGSEATQVLQPSHQPSLVTLYVHISHTLSLSLSKRSFWERTLPPPLPPCLPAFL